MSGIAPSAFVGTTAGSPRVVRSSPPASQDQPVLPAGAATNVRNASPLQIRALNHGCRAASPSVAAPAPTPMHPPHAQPLAAESLQVEVAEVPAVERRDAMVPAAGIAIARDTEFLASTPLMQKMVDRIRPCLPEAHDRITAFGIWVRVHAPSLCPIRVESLSDLAIGEAVLFRLSSSTLAATAYCGALVDMIDDQHDTTHMHVMLFEASLVAR